MKIAVAVAVLCLGSTVLAQTPSPIAYKTVAQAYNAMRANAGAKAQQDADGWITVVVGQGADEGIWTFPPKGNPAFPSVVKRQVIDRDGHLFVAMDVLCQAKKEPCDALVADFNQMNQEMAKELQARGKR